MQITDQQLISAIEQKNGFPLDPDQRIAIHHNIGPLWIIAGPGTGKTEVLVIRCLKLACCNNINPKSIMVTTFTQKAARSLEDRISETMLYLIGQYPQLSDIDISQLRIGTLHSLCNDILQEYRYVNYQNLRLLDDIESKMLIRDQIAGSVRSNFTLFQARFQYLFGNMPYPNLWEWTKALKLLLDRLVEDQIDIASMRRNNGVWQEVAQIYDLYVNKLHEKYSCDFAHLQKHFLDFLQTPQGQTFLNGDGTSQYPPLKYILVDEYQDTNPIQEQIYFTLAANMPHNLTVVGDDDQALYRFRGGTVESMVGFSNQCQRYWNIMPNQATLIDNHRSSNKIVDWCNTYITSFPIMTQNNARVQGKPLLNPSSGRFGLPASVGLIREGTVTGLASTFANTVQGLISNGIIDDYSQCVLLLRSAKDSVRNAGPYLRELEQRGIPVYNPRSRSFLDQPEVQQVLGALISILDPNLDAADPHYLQDAYDMILEWVNAYNQIASQNNNLRDYVTRSQRAIRQQYTVNHRITPAVATILYRILSHQPFVSYQGNQEQDLRLSKLTRLLEAFCSQQGRSLYMDSNLAGRVNQYWLSKFYSLFCGYLADQGIDDDEDEEIVCPIGRLPIMTIHQSKGLQFDFVFVGSLGSSVTVGKSHQLENDLRQFRIIHPVINHSANDSAWHDDIRLHFVAYSRAKYALVLLATDGQLRKRAFETASFGGNGGPWVRQNILRL